MRARVRRLCCSPLLLAAVMCVLIGAAGFALAASATPRPTPPSSPSSRGPATIAPPPSPLTPTQQASVLIGQATNHVVRAVAGCSFRNEVPTPRVRYSDGTPDAALLRVLGVLRRPPTAEELHARSPLPADDGDVTFFRRYSRIVRGPDGFVTRIAVGTGQVSLPAIELPPCQRHVNATLRHLLRGQPHEVQHLALKMRRSFKLGPQVRRVEPWLDYVSRGGVTGPFDVKRFRTHGLSIVGGERGHYDLNGLVPDGVARIELEIGAGVSRPSSGDPGGEVIAPYRATETVHDNAFGFRLTESPFGAHVRLVWRDAAGRVIRVIARG